MRRIPYFRPFLGGLALVVAAACSDATGPDFNDTFTEEDAEWAAYDVANNVEYLVGQLDFGLPYSGAVSADAALARALGRRGAPRTSLGARAFLAAPQLAARAGCTVTASGTEGDVDEPYDGNHNGIPDDYRLTYDCVEQDPIGGDTVETERYRQEVRIQERAGDLHGYELSFVWDESAHTSAGDWWRERSEWREVLSIRADRATLRWTEAGVDEGDWNGDRYREEWSEESDGEFTPVDAIVPGEGLPAGTLRFDGMSRYVDADWGAIEFRFDAHEPLTYSPSCAADQDQPFVDGALRGAFLGDVDRGFRISYASCGNGSDLEIYGDTEPAVE